MTTRIRSFWNTAFAELKNVRSLTLASLLTAIYAVTYSPVAGNIIIVPGLIEIRLGFVAVAVAAMLCGPVMSMLVAVLGDLIGTVLFYGGSFYFGYTFTWLVMGLIFGCFFYRHKTSLVRIIGAMLVDLVVVKLLLTTLWQTLMFSSMDTFFELLVTRVVRNLIFLPMNIILLTVALRSVMGIYKRVNRTAYVNHTNPQ